MLDVAVAQLRYAAALVLGRPCPLWALDRLIAAAQATQREFGAVESAGGELLRGPTLDEETRRAVQVRHFRAQAVRGARETAYYGDLFARLGLDPARLREEDIARLPVTPKEAVRTDPDAFVRRTAKPTFRTTTTGTTGRPTSVAFSEREIQTAAALAALSFLVHGALSSADIVQISTSSRATLGNTCFAGACARIGALWYLTGLVEPAHALALLAEEHHLPGKKPRASVMSTYPSYLGELVECGLQMGYRPVDFGLERISVGGEVVTEGLKARCQELFGPVQFDQGYAMTETWPLLGTRCEQGHLHFEASQGLVEVLALEATTPALPGDAGRIVATPFRPYRDASVMLRYDSEDLVRPLASPLSCSMRNLPATSDVLGKLRLSVRHEAGWTFPREVVEALEANGAVPLPARCGFWAVPGGVAVEVVARQDTPAVRRAIAQSLEEHGVPVRALHVQEDPRQLQHPRPLRCDLRETSFSPLGLDRRPGEALNGPLLPPAATGREV
jgi:phenylacetate-coenzyme A ligase PaaK-like adenylate-forming protein